MKESCQNDKGAECENIVDVYREWERTHNRENYGRYDAFKTGYEAGRQSGRQSAIAEVLPVVQFYVSQGAAMANGECIRDGGDRARELAKQISIDVQNGMDIDISMIEKALQEAASKVPTKQEAATKLMQWAKEQSNDLAGCDLQEHYRHQIAVLGYKPWMACYKWLTSQT